MNGLRQFMADLTWTDVLASVADILLVYYAIYRVLLLIKGTRAAQMVIGLLVIIACFFFAQQARLATVGWLLDNFINYFIILIIVVFQQDIRRGLVRMGQNLFSFGRTYEETHVFEEVIHAVDKLARARIGALIVFEREADLGEFIETSQPLDAKVAQQVLVAVFVPSRDNVLHDGAVIIKHLRIQQAGAVLPLTANPRLDKALGTRHRAAIGITEETDAVALVVSEERGEISLCFHGNIARDLDIKTLRKALLGLFYKERRRRRRGDTVRAQAAAAEAAAVVASLERRAADSLGPVSDEDGREGRGADATRSVRRPRPVTVTPRPSGGHPVVPAPPASASTSTTDREEVTEEPSSTSRPAGAPEAG